MDEVRLRRMEEKYGVLESMSIDAMITSLKQRKLIQLIEEPVRLTNLFTKLDRRLMKPNQQRATKWIIHIRQFVQPPPTAPIDPHVNIRLYPGFRAYRVLEWQTCKKV